MAFERFGKEISFAAIREQIGKGADQLLPVFFSRNEIDDFGKEMEKYRSDLFKREFLPKVKGFPKVRELFQRIKQDNKRVALASSAKEDELESYKKIAQIADLVESEVSADDAAESKPSPDIFEVALQKLRLNPDKVIVIGDTRYDVEAAAKAKLHTIGLLCGGSTEKELRQAGCVAIYRDPADLLSQYEKSLLRSI